MVLAISLMSYFAVIVGISRLKYYMENVDMAWFFPAFWSWYGFSVLMVSSHWIVTALESRAAPRSLLNS